MKNLALSVLQVCSVPGYIKSHFGIIDTTEIDVLTTAQNSLSVVFGLIVNKIACSKGIWTVLFLSPSVWLNYHLKYSYVHLLVLSRFGFPVLVDLSFESIMRGHGSDKRCSQESLTAV